MSSRLERERTELATRRGCSCTVAGKVGASSLLEGKVPRLSSQLPEDRLEREESIGEGSNPIEELSLYLGTDSGMGIGAVTAAFADFGGAAITKTSLDIKKSLGTGGTGGAFSWSPFLELEEALGAAEEDLARELEVRRVRVSKETLELEP